MDKLYFPFVDRFTFMDKSLPGMDKLHFPFVDKFFPLMGKVVTVLSVISFILSVKLFTLSSRSLLLYWLIDRFLTV